MEENYSVLPMETQLGVSNKFEQYSTILNMTNIINDAKETGKYDEIKEHISNVVVNYVEFKQNEKFNKSLNFLEKYVLDIELKKQSHQMSVNLRKALIGFSIRGAFDLLPVILNEFSKRHRNENLKEFLIGYLAYTSNGNNTIKLQNKVKQFYNQLGERFKNDEYMKYFDKYSGDGTRYFPMLDSSNKEYEEKLYYYILGSADLKNEVVKERCLEFATDYMHFELSKVETDMKNIESNNEYISDIVTFTSMSTSTNEVLKNMFGNYEKAKASSNYLIENDPFELKRIETKRKVNEALTGLTPIALGALTFYTGEIGDFILVASAPIINKLLNKEVDFKKAKEINSQIRKVAKEYNAKK